MEWKVPISDIDFDEQEAEAVQTVLKSKWLSTGEVTARFEAQFAQFVGTKHACALSSCTAALHLSSHILGIGPGDEVIVPSFTFIATVNAVLYCGGTPVFADIIDENCLHISADDVRKKISSKTKAIILVHYGGYCCNMDEFRNIAEENRLFLIEDAAHALGAYFKGEHAGTFGQFGCFSFFPNKNMTTAEGGMLIANDDKLAAKTKPARSHGLTTMTWDRHRGHAYSYDVPSLGLNYRIDEIRSAIGLVQLSKLRKNNQLRAKIVEYYTRQLEKLPDIQIPFKARINVSPEESPAYHLFPILAKDRFTRDELMKYLKERGIQTSIHYPPVHLFTHYRKRFDTRKGMLPKTEEVANRLVTLPLYPTLQEEQVNYVIECIGSFFKKN